MATAASVKAKLQRLIGGANATTGAADTTLTAAVNTLKSGYGSSGDDSDRTYFTYTWRGTSYKFYFLPGQTWDDWFNDTKYANVGSALIHFYGMVGITASLDWVQDENDINGGYDVADRLIYPDTGYEASSSEVIQPIEYGVIYWNN